MSSNPNDDYKKFAQKVFKGLNLDIPPEKLPPEYFAKLTNMMVGDKGLPETINGCSNAGVGNSDWHIGKAGYFPTRGEDYIFIYDKTHSNVKIFQYPEFDLYDTLFESNPLSSEPWFAEHNGEMYIGNMEEGMWRWRPGNQSLVRGAAPMDILVTAGEEGSTEKNQLDWLFAYDYEYKGGRSPLSRYSLVKLFKSKQKAIITMDSPPDISNNRRIYGTPDVDDIDNATWYFLKEITDSDIVDVELDSELVNRVTDDYKYNVPDADAAQDISPKALMGISHDNKLWVAYTVESPTIIRPSEIGQPYFNNRDAFDLKEIPTNIIGHKDHIIGSTDNKIFAITVEGDNQEDIVSEGAYRGTLQILNGALVWINEKGFRIFDGQKVDTISGINTIDFSGLQKEKRFILWSSQNEFNQGICVDGVSLDTIPGAIALQFMKSIGSAGYLEAQNTGSFKWLYDDPPVTVPEGVATSKDGIDYWAQPFMMRGDGSTAISINTIELMMREYGKHGNNFTFEIRSDDSTNPGNPDMNEDGLLVAYKGGVTNDVKWNKFKFDAINVYEATIYWLVIPNQGGKNEDWELNVLVLDWELPTDSMYKTKRVLPDGEYLKYSDNNGGTWQDYTGYYDRKKILQFRVYGNGQNIISTNQASAGSFGFYSMNKWYGNSDTHYYGRKLPIPGSDIVLTRGEILVFQKNLSPDYPTIEIRNWNNGALIATATDFTEEGDLLRFDWDGGTISQGTQYYLKVSTVGDGSNNWEWGSSLQVVGETYYATDGGWTETDTKGKGLYMKVFGIPDTGSDFASFGSWEGNTLDFSGDSDFKKFGKLFANKMLSGTTADIRIDVWTWVDATHEYTDEDVTLPFDIDATHPGAKKLKVTVDIDLGDASFTPIVDSLLVFYERDGDDGNRLHSVNLKGSYCISLEDYDDDGDTEFSYCLSKYGGWYKFDRAFYNYLPIGDDVVLGVGKNPNETYRNLYELDVRNVGQWYYGDTTPVDINTEIRTGYIGYNNIVKKYRKLFLSARGDEDAILYWDMSVGGSEGLSSDNVNESYSDRFALNEDSKYIYFSLPDRIMGKYFQLTISGFGAKWSFDGYKFELWEHEQTTTTVELPEGTEEVIVKLAFTISLTNPQSCCFYGDYLFVGTYGSIFYLKKYKVDSDGNLTLLKSITFSGLGMGIHQIKATENYLYVAYAGHRFAIYDHDLVLQDNVTFGTTSNCAMRIAISDDENHAWVSHTQAQKVFYLNIADKTNISASVDALTGINYYEVLYYSNYLFVSNLTATWLRVYDVSNPASVPYTLKKQITTKYIGRMVLGNDVDRIFYGGTVATNGPGIINIVDPTNPSVIVNDDGSSKFGRYIARKDKYLFVLDANTDKVMVIDMGGGYNGLTLESTLSTPIGDYNGTLDQVQNEEGLAFDGNNLLAYCSIISDIIYVFKIFGI